MSAKKQVPSDLMKLKEEANPLEALFGHNKMVDALNYLSKNLSFSTNFSGQMVDVTFAPNEQKVVPHSLGIVPKYRIILRQEGNGVISDIPSAWDRYSISLKNNGSNTVTITVMIVRE